MNWDERLPGIRRICTQVARTWDVEADDLAQEVCVHLLESEVENPSSRLIAKRANQIASRMFDAA